MKKTNKIVDERLEMETLRVERAACNIMFSMLAVSVLVQSWILQAPFKEYAWEVAILLTGTLVICIGTVRKGNWDPKRKPCHKSYFAYTMLGCIGSLIPFSIGFYIQNVKIYGANGFDYMISLVIFFICMFVLLYSIFWCSGSYAIHKQKEINKKLEKEENEEED